MKLEKQPISTSHPTGIPDKRIVPPYENKETTKEKFKALLQLLRGELDYIDAQNRPTVLDFHGLPEGFKDEDILKWIQKEMEVPVSYILENEKTQESVDFYRKLNYAYQIGKDFLINTLKYSENEVSIGPTSLSSQKDIFSLLHKTILSSGKRGLSKALLYCRIVKATLVASETLKNEAQQLKKNTENFESSLISSPLENDKITPLIMLSNDKDGKKFYATADGKIKGKITSRGKDIQKVMLRFITRAEADAKTALKDGIACRITIEEKTGLELLPIICKWLADEMEVSYIKIENESFFSSNSLDEIDNLLRKDSLKYYLENSESDTTSMGEFEALKISGRMNIPQEDKSGHAKQFEIQLVKPFNKNEKGKMDHNIFDVSKLVNVRTRLDGACPEHIFLQFVKDASVKSGISERKIIHYLTEIEKASIIKVKKKNNKGGKSVYIAHPVYSRWNNFGWVDTSLMSDIEYSKNKKTKEVRLP